MKKIAIIALLLLGILACKKKNHDRVAQISEVAVIHSWFNAWELVSEDIFKLTSYQASDFVFFDGELVYSTSRVTIPEGQSFDGPTLFHTQMEWRYKKHEGKIVLPSGDEVPLGIMSFAAPLEDQKNNTFFVMPLPSFWKSAGVESGVLPFQEFITGIFLHEFSHTQQMETFGKEASRIEADHEFPFQLTDNIVEDYFGKDSLYVKDFKQEVSRIYAALQSHDSDRKGHMADVLGLIQKRQHTYFADTLQILKPLDKLFLTMEGTGQFTMYAWLKHPEGGNLSADQALQGTRRGGWSQDEGLGLAVLLSKTSPPENWGNQMFGTGSATLIDLIEAELDKTNQKHK